MKLLPILYLRQVHAGSKKPDPKDNPRTHTWIEKTWSISKFNDNPEYVHTGLKDWSTLKDNPEHIHALLDGQ